MAVTQYIGSRYVPLFADPLEWSAEKSYEALTIVLHEGNSYTSKQAVPVGIELTNEAYWAQTGNYNAQIEQYRSETKESLDKVNQAVDDIRILENKITIISPYLQGTAVYIEHEGKKILMDCGDTTDSVRIASFLRSQNVTALDAVVITHFDHDHVGGFPAVSDFCNSSTDIFMQMTPPSGTTNYNTYYNSLTVVNDYISRNNLKAIRTPYEGEELFYGDIKLKLHNTTLNNRDVYESVNGEGTSVTKRRPTLNNYSLICIVNINDYKIIYSGDIEAAGQMANIDYVEKCELAFTPHHISALIGYLPYYMKMAPKQWLGTTAASTFGGKISINNRYIFKLLKYNYIDDVILTHNDSLIVSVYNGSFVIEKGESLFNSISAEDRDDVYTVMYQIIPPSYETTNPFIFWDITLQQLAALCYSFPSETLTATTALTERNNAQFIKDIKTLFYNNSSIDTSAISIRTGRYLDIQIHGVNLAYDKMLVYSNVDVENKTGYKIYKTGSLWKRLLSENITTNANLSEYLSPTEFNSLIHAKQCFVLTPGGLSINLFRADNLASNEPRLGSSQLIGVSANTTLTHIYHVIITGAGVLTCNRANLTTGVVENVDISAVGVCE